MLLDHRVRSRAGGLREEIIIPGAVRVGSQVGLAAGLSHNADVDLFAGLLVYGEKRFLLGFDAPNGRRFRQPPRGGSDAADVGDVLVLCAVGRGLRDAGYSEFFHGGLLVVVNCGGSRTVLSI